MKLLEEMANERRERSDSLLLLGNLHRREKQFAKAVQAYDRAMARMPKLEERHWNLFYSRGIANERTKNWQRAEADFKRALELKPNEPYVLNYLAYTWVDRGDQSRRSQAMLDEAVRQKPDDGAIVDSVGWAYYRLGQFDEGARAIEQAIELTPEDPTINDHLGDVYWRVGRPSGGALPVEPRAVARSRARRPAEDQGEAGKGPARRSRARRKALMVALSLSLPPLAGEGWMGVGPPAQHSGAGGRGRVRASAPQLAVLTPSGPRASARGPPPPLFAGEGRFLAARFAWRWEVRPWRQAVVKAAPAKLNLYLHVVGRAPDGYHLLDSLIAFAGVHDTIRATPANTLTLAVDGPFGAALERRGRQSRAARGARRCRCRGVRAGAALTLDQAPAGRLGHRRRLGRCRGDAAAAGACSGGSRSTPPRWRKLALTLGADVPVCLAGKAAQVGGIGENRARARAAGRCRWCWSIRCDAAADARRLQSAAPARLLETGAARGRCERPADARDLAEALKCRRNDLTTPRSASCPRLPSVLAALEAQPGCLLGAHVRQRRHLLRPLRARRRRARGRRLDPREQAELVGGSERTGERHDRRHAGIRLERIPIGWDVSHVGARCAPILHPRVAAPSWSAVPRLSPLFRWRPGARSAPYAAEFKPRQRSLAP